MPIYNICGEKKTALGRYREDFSGLWHYQFNSLGNGYQAAEDAIANRPGPTWFWFNGTPCPIFVTDNVKSLVERWASWRRSYQDNPDRLMDLIQNLPEHI